MNIVFLYILPLSVTQYKKYSLTQIFYALTQLIEDSNEIIIDKYGRNGKLINIGEYYLFQPIEITDKNISLYERMTPLPYKVDKIEFNLSDDLIKNTNDLGVR